MCLESYLRSDCELAAIIFQDLCKIIQEFRYRCRLECLFSFRLQNIQTIILRFCLNEDDFIYNFALSHSQLKLFEISYIPTFLFSSAGNQIFRANSLKTSFAVSIIMSHFVDSILFFPYKPLIKNHTKKLSQDPRTIFFKL